MPGAWLKFLNDTNFHAIRHALVYFTVGKDIGINE